MVSQPDKPKTRTLIADAVIILWLKFVIFISLKSDRRSVRRSLFCPPMNQDEFQLKISQLFIGLSDLIADHTAASTQAEERQYQSVLTKYLCTVFIVRPVCRPSFSGSTVSSRACMARMYRDRSEVCTAANIAM
jgi:hypothetical protein